jgi:hypothetical protein
MLRVVVVMVGISAGLYWGTVSMAVEEVLPPVSPDRTVRLNLAINDLEPDTLIQLKRKSNGVLAETLKSLPDKLEFEVIVAGPHGEIPVSFPVPTHNPVCRAYQMYKDTDPAKVLEAMEHVRRPIVRVVAVKTDSAVQTFVAGRLKSSRPNSYWKPFYEVSLPDAECSTPVLVPVPHTDCALHGLARQAVNAMLAPQDVVFVTQISASANGPDPCCPQCTSDTPSEQPPCRHCGGGSPCGHPPCAHGGGKASCGCGQPHGGASPSGHCAHGGKWPCQQPCGRAPCSHCAGKTSAGQGPCPHHTPKCSHCG